MSSQVMETPSAPYCDCKILIGPSKSFSTDFTRSGPTSLAPRLAARLSWRCSTPVIPSESDTCLSASRPSKLTFVIINQTQDITKGVRVALDKLHLIIPGLDEV